MSNAPIVRLLDHPADAGYLLEWRRTAKGWQARVEVIDVIPGPRGRLESHEVWIPAHKIEPLPSEDYSRVPRSHE